MAGNSPEGEQRAIAYYAAFRLAILADQTGAEPEFRTRLKDAPHAALRDYGLELSSEMEVRVVEDTGEVTHLVLPPNPNVVLADHALVGIVGGVGSPAGGTIGSVPSCRSSDMTANSEHHPDHAFRAPAPPRA